MHPLERLIVASEDLVSRLLLAVTIGVGDELLIDKLHDEVGIVGY